MNKITFSDFFKDSEGRYSIGRLSLVIGLLLSAVISIVYFVFFKNGDTTIWDWAICSTFSVIGLLAYLVSKAQDVKEFLGELALKFKKKE